jgi:hypothetical protein
MRSKSEETRCAGGEIGKRWRPGQLRLLRRGTGAVCTNATKWFTLHSNHLERPLWMTAIRSEKGGDCELWGLDTRIYIKYNNTHLGLFLLQRLRAETPSSAFSSSQYECGSPFPKDLSSSVKRAHLESRRVRIPSKSMRIGGSKLVHWRSPHRFQVAFERVVLRRGKLG